MLEADRVFGEATHVALGRLDRQILGIGLIGDHVVVDRHGQAKRGQGGIDREKSSGHSSTSAEDVDDIDRARLGGKGAAPMAVEIRRYCRPQLA
jgi:hypothetical protein